MKQKQSGSGLVFAVILLFVILGMVITLSSVTVLETKMSQKTKSSVGAFYNADSGVEWALNKIATNDVSKYINGVGMTFNGDAAICPNGDCKVYFLDSDGQVIRSAQFGTLTLGDIKAVRSVGNQNVGGINDSQRAVEAAVGATGGGCYVDYSLATGLVVGSPCGAVGGFTVKRSAGMWGTCHGGAGSSGYISVIAYYHRPPGGGCLSGGWSSDTIGEAYVCCQN